MNESFYGTDSLEEFKINDAVKHVNEWYKKTLLDKHNVLRNKKCLVFNELPLCISLALAENEVTYITTRKEYIKIAIPYAKYAVWLPEDNILKIDSYLSMKPSFEMNYIFANPPYDKDLFLDISEILKSHLAENGKMFVLSPTQCIENPFKNLYINTHADLFTHLESCTKVDDDFTSTFESFQGFTNLGIYTFTKEKVNRDIRKMWRNMMTKEEAALYKKIASSKLPKISDVMCKNTDKGCIVPIGTVGGCKRFLVYDKFVYYNDGECLIDGNKLSIKEYNGFGISNGKIAEGVPMKNTGQAIRFHKLYKDSYIMRGIFGMSLAGSQNVCHKFIPYISCENETTDKELIEILNLNEKDLGILKAYSKSKC